MNVFFTQSDKNETLDALTSAILDAKIKLAAARLEKDQDLVWEYSDHLEYLGDLYDEANKTSITFMMDDGFADTRNY